MHNFPTPSKLLDLDLHGGFSEDNKRNLSEIFKTKKIKTAIEVGSWLGLSSSFIASHVEKLYCIDIWELQPEQIRLKDWNDKGQNLYDQFLSNIIHLKLDNKIIPIKNSSQNALVYEKADLIFIDASHSYENVKADILKWNGYLNDGGIICGDDWGIPVSDISDGVVKAVMECSLLLNKKVYSDGTFWRLI